MKIKATIFQALMAVSVALPLAVWENTISLKRPFIYPQKALKTAVSPQTYLELDFPSAAAYNRVVTKPVSRPQLPDDRWTPGYDQRLTRFERLILLERLGLEGSEKEAIRNEEAARNYHEQRSGEMRSASVPSTDIKTLTNSETANPSWMDKPHRPGEGAKEEVSHRPAHVAYPRLRQVTIHSADVKVVHSDEARQFDHKIKIIARQHGVSPALVKAVIHAESKFNNQLVSRNGAVGLMQVRPSTARNFGVRNPHDPVANIVAGVRALKYLLDMFNNDTVLAVAAYNSGPSNVKKYGGVPPFPETQEFVAQVMAYYHSYQDS